MIFRLVAFLVVELEFAYYLMLWLYITKLPFRKTISSYSYTNTYNMIDILTTLPTLYIINHC